MYLCVKNKTLADEIRDLPTLDDKYRLSAQLPYSAILD